jgi:hypothetical protein
MVIRAIAGALLLAALPSWASSETAAGDAGTPYRFVRPPVVIYARLPPSNVPFYHVVFRLDHRLVVNHLGTRATLMLSETGDPTGPIALSRKAPCYLQELEFRSDDEVISHPRPGRKVRVTLRIKEPKKQTLTATVSMRRVKRSQFDARDGGGKYALAGC